MSGLRVVHVITRGDVGGAQTHVVELAAAQVRANAFDEVRVVAGCDGPAMDRALAAGVAVDIVPPLADARMGGSLRPAYTALTEALAAIDVDVVHGHSSHAGLLARIAARRRHLPSVYTAHGWPFQRGAAWSQRATSYLGEAVGGRVGDGVICLTDAEVERARRSRVVSPRRLWLVPNGIADVPPAQRRALSAPDGAPAPRLVMVARFAPPKRQRDLVETMAALADLPWSLTFVGDGPERAECQTVADRLVPGRVEFAGNRDDVVDLLAASDIALLWSRYEGMPMALLEAMRSAVCCVANDLPGVRVLFGDPSAGVIAEDTTDLAAALRRLLSDPALIDDYGALARQRYLDAFTADEMERATRRVYEAVLSGRRRGRGGGTSSR